MWGTHERIKGIMQLDDKDARDQLLKNLALEKGCSVPESGSRVAKHNEQILISRIYQADRNQREARMWWITLLSVITSFVIAVCLVAVAVRQLYVTRDQATDARQANEGAQAALREIQKARADVLYISQSVIAIAEVLPRAGNPGGLALTDLAKIKEGEARIKDKIKELENQPK